MARATIAQTPGWMEGGGGRPATGGWAGSGCLGEGGVGGRGGLSLLCGETRNGGRGERGGGHWHGLAVTKIEP